MKLPEDEFVRNMLVSESMRRDCGAGIFSLAEYLPVLVALRNKSEVDFPIVCPSLDVVISRVFAHELNVGLLGKVISMQADGGNLDSIDWHAEIYPMVSDVRMKSHFAGIFYETGGYSFSSSRSGFGRYRPICIISELKHSSRMSSFDRRVVELLECEEFDHR